jgi:hypothetical protein
MILKHLKTIHEFTEINEQLFAKSAELFAKMLGASSETAKKAESVDLKNEGALSIASDKKANLVVVYGGEDIDGKKSGEYIANNFTGKIGSINLFIAKDGAVDGAKSYKNVKKQLEDKSVKPAKKVLYIFSKGSEQGMSLLKTYGASEFDAIYMADIFLGNGKVADFYKELAKNNKEKLRYFYTKSGSGNDDATKTIADTLTYKKTSGNNDHKETNKDATSDLLSKI